MKTPLPYTLSLKPELTKQISTYFQEPPIPADLSFQDRPWIWPDYVMYPSWLIAWLQVPAGSLPGDDRELARLAGFGDDLEKWLLVKPHFLGGFSLYSDGRYYCYELTKLVCSLDRDYKQFEASEYTKQEYRALAEKLSKLTEQNFPKP